MSIKKNYSEENGTRKITFTFKENINSIDTVRIPGEFNNWDVQCVPMKRLKTGGFSQTIRLEAGKSYQFRYLINDSVWANDQEADEYVPNGFCNGEVNSTVVL